MEVSSIGSAGFSGMSGGAGFTASHGLSNPNELRAYMAPLGSASSGGSHIAGVSAASPSDVSHFQRLLGRQPVQGTAPVSSIANSAPADMLAQGIREAANSYNNRFEALKQGLQRVEKQQSIASLLEYQLESAKMGVEMEMTGKIVSKVVQDVEQLTKQQG